MRSRDGFALIVALTLVALVGLATTVVMRSFTDDARRTRNAQRDAQLSQLITAGAIAARDMLNRGEMAGTLQLPGELTAQGATVTVKSHPDADGTVAEIFVNLGAAQREATLHFVRAGQQWRID